MLATRGWRAHLPHPSGDLTEIYSGMRQTEEGLRTPPDSRPCAISLKSHFPLIGTKGMPDHSLLLSIEGIDATGKTEIALAIESALDQRSLRVYGVHDPPLELDPWPQVKALMFDRQSEASEISEAWFFLAARLDMVQREIVPALSEESFVIADRYIDSWVAYHCHRLRKHFESLEESIDFLSNIHLALSNVGLLPFPRRTWLVEDDPDEAMKRRFEAATKWETPEKQRNVAAAYEMIASRDPRRIIRIDARGRPFEEVRNRIVTEAIEYCVGEANVL